MGAIIGRPGLMKTPALQEPMKPLARLESQANKDYQQSLQQSEAAKLIAKVGRKLQEKEIAAAIKTKRDTKSLALASITDEEGETPVRKRFLVNDSTVEKLGEILNGTNPKYSSGNDPEFQPTGQPIPGSVAEGIFEYVCRNYYGTQ